MYRRGVRDQRRDVKYVLGTIQLAGDHLGLAVAQLTPGDDSVASACDETAAATHCCAEMEVSSCERDDYQPFLCGSYEDCFTENKQRGIILKG